MLLADWRRKFELRLTYEQLFVTYTRVYALCCMNLSACLFNATRPYSENREMHTVVCSSSCALEAFEPQAPLYVNDEYQCTQCLCVCVFFVVFDATLIKFHLWNMDASHSFLRLWVNAKMLLFEKIS